MADLRPQYTEEAVGANHPTKADVINRAWNVEHEEDGTHGFPKGIFTPDLQFGGAKVGITYSKQAGRYTLIGDRCFFNIEITLTSKGVSNGDISIKDLPFTSKDADGVYSQVGKFLNNFSFADYPMFYILQNTSIVYAREITNAGVNTTLTDANMADNSTVNLTGVYEIA